MFVWDPECPKNKAGFTTINAEGYFNLMIKSGNPTKVTVSRYSSEPVHIHRT